MTSATRLSAEETPLAGSTPDRIDWWTVSLVCALVGSLLFRAFIIADAPLWGWDEALYLHDARLHFEGASDGYIFSEPFYPWLLQFSFFTAEEFRDGVQAINLTLASLGVLGVFLCGVQIMAVRKALFLALIASISGWLSISAYAMTEPLLFALFWLILAAIIAAFDRFAVPDLTPASYLPVIGLGVLIPLSVASSPKLTVAILSWAVISVAWFMVEARTGAAASDKRSILIRSAACLGAVAITYVLLQVFAYRPSRDFYATVASDFTLTVFAEQLGNNWTAVLDLLSAHVAVSLAPFPAALVILIAMVISSYRLAPRARLLMVLGIVGLALLVVQAIVFSITRSLVEPSTLSRALARYYSFGLPIFTIALVLAVAAPARIVRAIIVLVTLVTAVSVYFSFFSGQSALARWGGVENAGQWYNQSSTAYLAVFGLTIISSCIMAFHWRIGRYLALFAIALHGILGSLGQARDLDALAPTPPEGCQVLSDVANELGRDAGMIHYELPVHERTRMSRFGIYDIEISDNWGAESNIASRFVASGALLGDLPTEMRLELLAFPLLLVENLPVEAPDQPGIILRTPDCILFDTARAFANAGD